MQEVLPSAEKNNSEKSLIRKCRMNHHHKFKDYIYWGITAFCVIAASIAFAYLLVRFEQVKAAGAALFTILTPIIYGAVLAYLLAPVYNWCIAVVDTYGKHWVKSDKRRESAGKFLGTTASLVILYFIVAGLFSMLIPQIHQSIKTVLEALPENINHFYFWVEERLNNNPDIREQVTFYLDQAMQWGKTLGKDVVAPNLDKIVGSVSSGMFSVINWLKNVLIGLIVMIYLLNMKGSLLTIAKKCIYGIFPLAWAKRLIEEAKYTHSVFGGFIIGKLVDSLIIGIICFFCMTLMKLPYVMLISVIIGVTNIIPFFGPFIGAVPSAVLVLLNSPIQCVYFLIFILILQQFDGNILGPRILGESTGISGFWVLFSILLFGGVFGFVGMIIGVPTFAVIYRLLSDIIKMLLRKRGLPEETSAYAGAVCLEEGHCKKKAVIADEEISDHREKKKPEKGSHE